jgi:phosphatidylinositol alpha-1,6-mannosyltransferase
MKGPVIIATLEWPPRKGGIATYLANLAHAMPKGSVHVLAEKDPEAHKEDMKEETPIYRRRLIGRLLRPRWLGALYWTDWLRRKEKASLLVVSHLLPMGKVARILKQRRGLPYVVILHGMDVALCLEAGGKKLAAAKAVLADASLVVANSAFTAHLAESVGVPQGKIMVARPSPGIKEGTRVSPERARDVRAHHGLGEGFVVLALGRLVKRKGFDTLIEAAAVLRKRGAPVMLAICGDGPERKRLEHLAWKHGVAEQVRFLGRVSDAELPEVYAACDAFVMVPRSEGADVEGFGIVYLEANMMGKPVVGSRAGGVPDAIVDGKTGLLVRPGDPIAVADAIERLRGDAAFALRLGAEGRRRAHAEFGPKAQLGPLVDLLTSERP